MWACACVCARARGETSFYETNHETDHGEKSGADTWVTRPPKRLHDTIVNSKWGTFHLNLRNVAHGARDGVIYFPGPCVLVRLRNTRGQA